MTTVTLSRGNNETRAKISDGREFICNEPLPLDDMARGKGADGNLSFTTPVLNGVPMDIVKETESKIITNTCSITKKSAVT